MPEQSFTENLWSTELKIIAEKRVAVIEYVAREMNVERDAEFERLLDEAINAGVDHGLAINY